MSVPEFENRQEVIQGLERPTEVFDHVEGMNNFFHRIENWIVSHPNQTTLICIVGETGLGKSTLAGQIIAKLEDNQKLQEKLQSVPVVDSEGRDIGEGKHLGIYHFSLAKSLDLLTAKGVLKSEWGKYTPEEYMENSVFMADILSLANTYLSVQDPRSTNVIIFDSVSITKSADRGAFTIKSQDHEGRFVIALTTNADVQENAVDLRDGFWETDDPALLGKQLDKHGVKLDKELEENDAKKLRKAMGNRIAKQRGNEDVNNAIIEAKEILVKMGCPDFTLEELQDATKTKKDIETDPKFLSMDESQKESYLEASKTLRAEVVSFYLEYFCKEILGVPKDKLLVATNRKLGKEGVSYYLSLLEEHALPIEDIMKSFLLKYRIFLEEPKF